MNVSQNVFLGQERDLRSTDAEIGSAVGSLARRLSLLGETVDASALCPAVERVSAIQRDQPIWAERNHSNRIFVLENGFAFAFSLYPDGRRHIGDIFAPGALCNWSSVWGGMLIENVIFKARSRVIVLDRDRLIDVIADQRHLREAIERHEHARCHRRQQRCRGLIALPAVERLALTLLDIQDELRAGGNGEDWIGLPLTLRELGDLTGLTDVHVSRTLKKLQEMGFMEKRGKRFRLNAEPRMQEALDYQYFFSAGTCA